jgi:hypothetical protein
MVQSYGRKFVHADSGVALQYYMLASVMRGNSIAGEGGHGPSEGGNGGNWLSRFAAVSQVSQGLMRCQHAASKFALFCLTLTPPSPPPPSMRSQGPDAA